MRPQKVLEKEMLLGLTKVFRSKGYEGASLQELAEATGLKKASLYHRFPKGKQEMATAVIEHLDKWVEENIFHVLLDENMPLQHRLKTGLDNIRTLYDNGNEVCIMRALSMETGLTLFEEQINIGMKRWIDAFYKFGIALNYSPDEAKRNALQTLIEIQGGLIVTKGMKDLGIFKKMLQKIENRYLSK